MQKGPFTYAKTGDSFTVYGVASGVHSWEKDAGTYKLHFTTNGASQGTMSTADINGTVYSAFIIEL
jgi:hypothetical protein